MIRTEIKKEESYVKTYTDKIYYRTSDDWRTDNKEQAEARENDLKRLNYIPYNDTTLFEHHIVRHSVVLTDENVRLYRMVCMHNTNDSAYMHLRGRIFFVVDEDNSDYPLYHWWTIEDLTNRIAAEKKALDDKLATILRTTNLYV